MPGLAFSFAKKAEPKRVVKELVEKKHDGRVAIVGLEEGQLTVDGDAEAEKELKIPCKNPLSETGVQKAQRLAKASEAAPGAAPAPAKSALQEGIESNLGGLLSRNVSKLSAEDAEAVAALCQDAGGHVDAANVPVIPILMRTGSKAAREGTAPEATKDMFDAVPVENFGVALLRGMGYDPTKHATKPVFHDKPRDMMLGLGAKALLPSEKAPVKKKGQMSASGAVAKQPSAGGSESEAPRQSEVPKADAAAEVAPSLAAQSTEPKRSALEERAEKRRRTDKDADSVAAVGTSQQREVDDVWPSRALVVRISDREKDKQLRQFSGCDAVVLEVDEVGKCCRIKARLKDKSHVLQAVPVRSLEPVVNAECTQVRVVRGRHRGVAAELLHRSERRGVARVQIDKSEVELPLRDVCEFIASKR